MFSSSLGKLPGFSKGGEEQETLLSVIPDGCDVCREGVTKACCLSICHVRAPEAGTLLVATEETQTGR